MIKRTLTSLTLAVAFCSLAIADEPRLLKLTGDLEVHDPAIAKQGDIYYLFCTGGFRRGGVLPLFTSPDLQHWHRVGSIIEKLPESLAQAFPKTRFAWAPDISYFNGSYHLYYAISTFGSNDSAILLATNTTLDPASHQYRWTDQGVVVRSRPEADNFNAIDPNIAVEDERNVWLSWGSFWGGIMMQRIDPQTGHVVNRDKIHELATRPHEVNGETHNSGGPIEAPFLVRHGDYWYLFVSWDYCCRGSKSDYKVVVGRATSITGPYLDRRGTPMTEGGGTLVIEANAGEWRGAGHPAVLAVKETDYIVFHAYSATTGRPQLQISTITWDDGWPRVASLP